MPADARTRLTAVDREVQSIREDLRKVDTGTPQAMEQMRLSIERRLSAAEQNLDRVDD